MKYIHIHDNNEFYKTVRILSEAVLNVAYKIDPEYVLECLNKGNIDFSIEEKE